MRSALISRSWRVGEPLVAPGRDVCAQGTLAASHCRKPALHRNGFQPERPESPVRHVQHDRIAAELQEIRGNEDLVRMPDAEFPASFVDAGNWRVQAFSLFMTNSIDVRDEAMTLTSAVSEPYPSALHPIV